MRKVDLLQPRNDFSFGLAKLNSSMLPAPGPAAVAVPVPMQQPNGGKRRHRRQSARHGAIRPRPATCFAVMD